MLSGRRGWCASAKCQVAEPKKKGPRWRKFLETVKPLKAVEGQRPKKGLAYDSEPIEEVDIYRAYARPANPNSTVLRRKESKRRESRSALATQPAALCVAAITFSTTHRHHPTTHSSSKMSDTEHKSFTLQTASFDARFPNQNQTKHCWQKYVHPTHTPSQCR